MVSQMEIFRAQFSNWSQDKRTLERERFELRMHVVSLEKGLDGKVRVEGPRGCSTVCSLTM